MLPRDWTESRNTLQVSARDGSGLRTVDAQRGNFGWAFDGTRLAWIAQPCAQTVIQVWDLSTNPPPARALRPRPAGASLALSRNHRWLNVVLRCPQVPAAGCAGVAQAVLYRGIRRLASTLSGSYRIEAGKLATVRLDVRGRPHITGGIRRARERRRKDSRQGRLKDLASPVEARVLTEQVVPRRSASRATPRSTSFTLRRQLYLRLDAIARPGRSATVATRP